MKPSNWTEDQQLELEVQLFENKLHSMVEESKLSPAELAEKEERMKKFEERREKKKRTKEEVSNIHPFMLGILKIIQSFRDDLQIFKNLKEKKDLE